MSRIMREIINAPLPEMIEKLGLGIANAQYQLDRNALRIAMLMGGFSEDQNGRLVQDDSALVTLVEGEPKVSLISLGFAPTFYQFTETMMEIKMSFSMTKSRELGFGVSAGFNIGIASASVSASYAQKYQYSAEASSLIRTKLVSLPPPPIFEERLKEIAEMRAEAQEIEVNSSST